jgi:hypothetical protein
MTWRPWGPHEHTSAAWCGCGQTCCWCSTNSNSPRLLSARSRAQTGSTSLIMLTNHFFHFLQSKPCMSPASGHFHFPTLVYTAMAAIAMGHGSRTAVVVSSNNGWSTIIYCSWSSAPLCVGFGLQHGATCHFLVSRSSGRRLCWRPIRHA